MVVCVGFARVLCGIGFNLRRKGFWVVNDFEINK